MKEPNADKWLSIQSVAETLGCTDKYVYLLIQQGALKAIKLGERALRISEKSLNAFIASRLVNPDDYFAPPEEEKTTKVQKPPIARSNWMNRS